MELACALIIILFVIVLYNYLGEGAWQANEVNAKRVGMENMPKSAAEKMFCNNLRFGDIIINLNDKAIESNKSFYGLVVEYRGEVYLFGTTENRLFFMPISEFLNSAVYRGGGAMVKRINYNLSDFDKSKIIVAIRSKLAQSKSAPGEFKMVPGSVLIQQILMEANVISQFSGSEFPTLEENRGLYFGAAPINYGTMNKMANYMQSVKFNCLS